MLFRSRNTSPIPRRERGSFGNDPAPEDPLVVGGFGSDHASTVIVIGLADGAVRTLLADISPDILRQLGHRADGELPASDEEW